MHLQTSQNKRGRYRGTPKGKCKIMSFGGHELELIDVWEQLARIEGTTDSGYFKKYLRSEKSKLRDLEEVQDKFSGFVLWTKM